MNTLQFEKFNANSYVNDRVIDIYVRDSGIGRKDAENHFAALKSFLFLCSRSKYPCYPDNTIDKIWHTFVLFTREYHEFCESYLGKFVHHNPITEKEKSNGTFYGYECSIDPNNESQIRFVLGNVNQPDCDPDGSSSGDCRHA